MLTAVCGSQDQADLDDGVAIRDSAGVQIVENVAVRSATPTWAVDIEPMLVIGDEDGMPLHGVTGAVLLSDGGFAIANMSVELLFFDADGTLRRRAGGEGDGPGEFRQLITLQRYSTDSVAAYNSFPARVSIFSESGEYGRDVAFSSVIDFPRPLSSGRWVGSVLHPMQLGQAPALVNRAQSLVIASADGTIKDTVARLPGRNVYGTTASFILAPFSPGVTFATRDNNIIAGWGGHEELVVYDPTGDRRQVLRNIAPGRAVSPQERAEVMSAIEQSRGRAHTSEGGVDRGSDWDPPIPERAPAFQRILIAMDGALWVERFSMPSDTIREWHIYDPAGLMMGQVFLPLRFRLLDAARARLAGIWLDDLDVQTVRILRLDQRGRPHP